MIYNHTDRESAVSAALKAVMSLQTGASDEARCPPLLTPPACMQPCLCSMHSASVMRLADHHTYASFLGCPQGPDSGEDEEAPNGIEAALSCPAGQAPGNPGLAGLARSASDGSTSAGAPNGGANDPLQPHALQHQDAAGGVNGGANGMLGGGGGVLGAERHAAQELAPREDLASALNSFPGCKRLVDAYRRIFRIPNKTPLSVLYEYASRLNLEVRIRVSTGAMHSIARRVPRTCTIVQ
jgi:hypothetical protein